MASWVRARWVSLAVGAAYVLARVLPLFGTTRLLRGDSVDYMNVASQSWFSGRFWAGSRPLLYPLLW
jgi:hypothetical protein